MSVAPADIRPSTFRSRGTVHHLIRIEMGFNDSEGIYSKCTTPTRPPHLTAKHSTMGWSRRRIKYAIHKKIWRDQASRAPMKGKAGLRRRPSYRFLLLVGSACLLTRHLAILHCRARPACMSVLATEGTVQIQNTYTHYMRHLLGDGRSLRRSSSRVLCMKKWLSLDKERKHTAMDIPN